MKKYLIIGIIILLLPLGFFLITTLESKPEEQSSQPTESNSSTKEVEVILSAIQQSFGQPDYPDKYMYDRPIEATADPVYFGDNNEWVLLWVRILDEPTDSKFRDLSFTLKKEGTKYKVITNYEATDLDNLPADMPDDLKEAIMGSYG